MARAKRHYLPGYIWHITHRCHKREFLLNFSKDRHRYLQWLYQARKRYGLSILDHMVTSNHVHLLVRDNGERDVIPNFREMADLADAYRGWIEEAIGEEGQLREGKWSESIAVGSESFVMMTKEKMGIKAKGREVVGEDGSYALRESAAPYNSILGHENDVLRSENVYFWDLNAE